MPPGNCVNCDISVNSIVFNDYSAENMNNSKLGQEATELSSVAHFMQNGSYFVSQFFRR